MNLNNGDKYLAKHLDRSIDDSNRWILKDFSREVDICSRINHPSISQFAGYALNNYKKSINQL